MKTGDLVKLLGVSDTTIREWIRTFSNYFSDGAQAKGTKQRTFTESDILTLATIAKLSADGLGLERIAERLEDGERVDHAGVAGISALMPIATAESLIDATAIRSQLAHITQERDRLAQMLEMEQNENHQLRDELRTAQEKLLDLTERAARAETEARMLKEQAEKRRGWFG